MSPFITTKKKYAEVSRQNMTRDTSRALVAVNAALLVVALVVAVGYVWLMQRTVSRGYEIKRLQEQLTLLTASQEELSRQASELQSPEKLAERASAMQLVPAGTLAYTIPATAVAKAGGNAVE